jgi:hypothetical protein
MPEETSGFEQNPRSTRWQRCRRGSVATALCWRGILDHVLEQIKGNYSHMMQTSRWHPWQ